jgi:hypothetical protein
MNKEARIIKIGEEYNFFDDGKVRLSRMDTVIISDIIPYNQDSEILKIWNKYKIFYPFNNIKSEYFIKAVLSKTKEELIFAKTLYHGWFSFGENSIYQGELDINGDLTAKLRLKL